MNPEISLQDIYHLLHHLDIRTARFERVIEQLQEAFMEVDNMELSSAEMIRLVGISRAELARWRASGVIPFRYISANHVAYPFKGVYTAIKSGRATFRGFRKIEALHQLEAFRQGAVKSLISSNDDEL